MGLDRGGGGGLGGGFELGFGGGEELAGVAGGGELGLEPGVFQLSGVGGLAGAVAFEEPAEGDADAEAY